MMTITHKVKQEKRFYDIDEGKHVSERQKSTKNQGVLKRFIFSCFRDLFYLTGHILPKY